MSALILAPSWLRRSAAACQVLRALDRGEALLVPARLAEGVTVQVLAWLARQVGAPVVVLEGIAELTTRERVDA